MPLSFLEAAPAPSLALPWEADIIALRRDFHTFPELGFEEERTAGIVAERLRELGLEVTTGLAVTGVKGVLRGSRPGPTVLVRADMDALPVQEENEWPWASRHAGKMHACGHDAHTAIALTVARLLVAEKEHLPGHVVFMFQPAEEGMGGAARMIEDGVLRDPAPDFALGLHMWSDTTAGHVALSPGPVMAAGDEFHIRITGRQGHGALPHQTVDPIVVAAHLITALQTVASRNVNPQQAGVVSVGKMQAGTAFNIIPAEVTLSGTLRALDAEVRELLQERCRSLVEDLPRAFGAAGTWECTNGFPAVVNDPTVTEWVRAACATVASTRPFTPITGSEDFALVLDKIPGCYFFIGIRNAELNAVFPHHHPRFSMDEAALGTGALAMKAAVAALLERSPV